MKYTVVINKTEYGYDAHCPAIENITDAITTYLHMIEEETKDATVYQVEVPA